MGYPKKVSVQILEGGHLFVREFDPEDKIIQGKEVGIYVLYEVASYTCKMVKNEAGEEEKVIQKIKRVDESG